MSLRERLTEDMKTATCAKDQVSLGTICLINATVKQFGVDECTETDDAKITAILTKMVKQRKDSARICAEAGRRDLANKEDTEMEILYRCLPQMMSVERIQAVVAAAVTQTGASGMVDMGRIMGVLKTSLADKADMGEVNKILKAVLSA